MRFSCLKFVSSNPSRCIHYAREQENSISVVAKVLAFCFYCSIYFSIKTALKPSSLDFKQLKLCNKVIKASELKTYYIIWSAVVSHR